MRSAAHTIDWLQAMWVFVGDDGWMYRDEVVGQLGSLCFGFYPCFPLTFACFFLLVELLRVHFSCFLIGP
jgi:hypothetical protein